MAATGDEYDEVERGQAKPKEQGRDNDKADNDGDGDGEIELLPVDGLDEEDTVDGLDDLEEEDVEDGADDADESGSAVDGLDGDLAAWDEVEREYGVFQREAVEFIYYHFVYMGRRKPAADATAATAAAAATAAGFDVREVKTEVLEFAEGKTALESSVLMSLIKNNEVHRRRRYKVHKMLRYNVTADIQKVEAVVKGGDAALDVAPYFKTFECYTDIPFDDGMIELDGHNALYVFMAEDAPLRGAHARRSRGRQRGGGANNNNNNSGGGGGRPFRRTRHAPTSTAA